MAIKPVYSEDKKCMVWRADYSVYINGKRKRIRKDFMTKPAAEKAVKTDWVAADKGEFRQQAKVTLQEWKDKVMVYVRAQRHGSTPKQYEHILSEFISHLGPNRKIESIDRNDFNKYVQYLRNEGMSEASIKTYLSKVKGGLNMAPQLFDSLINWQVPSYRIELRAEPRTRVLEVEELRRLKAALASSHQDHLDVVLCALNTGGRLREVLSLSWDRVLWGVGKTKHGKVKLKVTKTRGKPLTYRMIPITNELASILRRRQAASTSPFVFPSDRGKNKHRNYMDAPLKAACKAANIIYGRDVENGFIFHDLRRTSVTYLRRAGVEIEEVIKITGHSAVIMLTTYSQTSDEQLQIAMDKLENALDTGQLRESGETENEEKLIANVEDESFVKMA